MSPTLLTAVAWLAVLAMVASAVLFGRLSRTPSHRPRDARTARNRRIGLALSISGPIIVVLVAFPVAALTGAWLLLAVLAFAGVAAVALAGLVLTPQ